MMHGNTNSNSEAKLDDWVFHVVFLYPQPESQSYSRQQSSFTSITTHRYSDITFKQTTLSSDNDQLDAHLLYFTIRLLYSSTCFKHYMFIIRRLNCNDAASGIVLSVVRCTGICRHNTDNAHVDKHSRTIPVILGRH